MTLRAVEPWAPECPHLCAAGKDLNETTQSSLLASRLVPNMQRVGSNSQAPHGSFSVVCYKVPSRCNFRDVFYRNLFSPIIFRKNNNHNSSKPYRVHPVCQTR